MSRKIYLAGPVTGISYQEAYAWRHLVSVKIEIYNQRKSTIHHLETINPIFGQESLVGENNIKAFYDNDPLATQQALLQRSYFNVSRADVVLANVVNAKRLSVGTIMEIGWAYALRKPVILVMEDDLNPHNSPLITQSAFAIVSYLDDAVTVAISLLN